MSPLPSTAESWDSDPDLVLPDGPLTLLQSDTEAEAETSSSSVSALFSNNGNHSVYSVDEPHSNDDYNHQKPRRSSQSSQDERSLHPSRRDKLSRTTHQTDEDDLDDDRKGGTLTLKTANSPSHHYLHCPQSTQHSTSPSSQVPTHEHDRSYSSNSSSECQSTIKASFLPLPNPDSQSNHHHPPKNHSRRSINQIDRTVLAVLASGAKGTVTRLEPSKRPSPVQAGLDWDEDIVLPEGGLQTIFRPTSHLTGDVKKQPSFASAISDELDDLHVGIHPSSSRSGSSSHTSRLNNQSTKSAIQCSTVNEEDGDFGDDFELPPSGQSINLTDLKKNHQHSISKPNSAISLTSSEFDGLDDDPFEPPKSSTSSRRDSIQMTTLPNSSANSISHSNGNRGSIDDNTPRIRTRPSLTPSLMSDRSSSSFPEIEDDVNEGFFDDIEFPPEFGILNNLAPAPTSSTPVPTSSATTPKPAPSALPDLKGKQPNRACGLDLQTFLRSKLQARTLMAERSSSSHLDQQLRQSISTFEDPNDERVEDGLEIETGSIHTGKLRSRKSSSLSSASSHAHQSGHNSYFQQVHGQKSKSKRITVPFPSSNSSTSTSHPSDRHARFSSNRSPLNQNPNDSHNRSTPAASSSTSTLSARPTSHLSLLNRPNSAIPPGTDTSTRVQSPLGNPSRAAKLAGKVGATSSLRARVSTMAACNGPPVLSASSQRTLKHKKSAAALKSINLGSSGPQSNSSSASDGRPPLSSPPGSNASSNGRGLQRKQSMPSLNNRESHTSGSGGLPARLGGIIPSGMSAASVWKSSAVPHPKARQQPYDYSSTPSSPNLISGSALPSYADPTRASMNRHVGASAAIPGSNFGLPDRSSSVNSRRSSTESVRVTACSPAPPPTTSTSVGSSRLTMPTIASRLKAKPSIIHEEHSSTFKRWTTNGISAVIPHQLRRPRRPRTYGDGTELDEFDDLPTSKEKEKQFTRAVKNTSNSIRASSKLGSVGTTNPNNEKKESLHHPVIGSSQRSRSRLEARKAEGVRRRALAINAHIKKISTKKGLIRQMSGNTLSQLSTNTEMRWNDEEARWEGNEHVLREFDNVLSTSSRPALISQLSIQSPHMRSPTGAMQDDMPESGLMGSFRPTKAHNHVVGGMIFDTESMSWKKVPGGEDEEDELQLESDEELELRWLADDESSSRQKPLGGVGTEGWNSLSSSMSSPHPQHSHESEDGTTRNRGRRSGTFWQACVEAEERHKKEIASWIPIDHLHLQQSSETKKPVKKSSSSSHQPVKLKKSNLSSNHAPSSTSSVYPHHKIHHLNPPSTTGNQLLSNKKPSSVVPPTHSHGRLSDPDRCYLQEIRKLVSEEF